MNKLSLIIFREYISRVRKKSFVVMTLLTPFLMIAIFVLPTILTNNSTEKLNIAIIDSNRTTSNFFKEMENIEFSFLSQSNWENKQKLLEIFDAILIVPTERKNDFIIYSDKQISLSFKDQIEKRINEKFTQQNLIRNGIDPVLLKKSKEKIKIKTKIIESNGEENTSNSEISLIIAMVSGFLIYFFIFMYGSMVMRGVIEEKVNRIIEIMISSVKPYELMIGKIIGIALVGITQFGIWILLFSLAIILSPLFIGAEQLANNDINQIMMNNSLSIEFLKSLPIYSLMFGFLFYFIGGYLLYGSLFASIGAAVDQETDSQQFVFPLTLPLILSFILIQAIVENPHSDLSYWFSIFPLTSPIIMMVRIPFGVPTIELIISIVVLTISSIFSIWLSAKIYRVGILMYGKKVTYKELWKWISYKR